MIAVLGGLGAACCWAMATVSSSRSGRIIDPVAVVGWVMLVGSFIAVPAAIVTGVPSRVWGSSGLWLALCGAANVAGLLLMYAAMRIGQVALVAPLISAEGAMAALIAIVFGEAIAPAVGVALGVIVCGIIVASLPPGSSPEAGLSLHSRSVLLAIGGSVAFGISLYATGRAGETSSAALVAASARVVGVPVITIPLALSGRLRITRRAAPLVVISGVCEVAGFYAYTAGSRHGIAVAAVLSSQSGTLAAVAGFLLLGERISRVQLGGVAIVVAGVAVLSVLQV